MKKESEKMSKRSEKNQHRRNPKVAFYLDEMDDITNDEEHNYDMEYIAKRSKKTRRKNYEVEELNSRKSSRINKKKTRKKKQKTLGKRILLYIVIFVVIMQLPMLRGIVTSFNLRRFSTRSNIPDTKGILLLGIDNSGGEDNINAGFTDSITYIGANFKNDEAVALPIYRDANIMQTCVGVSDNINRIYASHGINCLVESTAQFLGLPIDYYVIISMDGLVRMVNDLGTVEIVPTGTYCSDYGEDGQNYCFTEGESQSMTGAQTLAYIRYRGDSNGENRANRQMELVYAIKNRCMENMLVCYANVTPNMGRNIKTNIPITQLIDISHIFSSRFNLENLSVITGTNTMISSGWTQYPDEHDRLEKAEIIRNRIFV